VQGLIGVGQVIGQESIGLSALGELRLSPEAPSASVVWTENEPKLLRGYGLTDHPNIFGGLLALSLLLLLAGLTAARTLWFSLLTAAFTLGCLALLMSFSRSAGLSFALGLALVLALVAYRRDWPRLNLLLGICLAAALIGVAFLLPYAPYLGARVNPQMQAQGSTESRSLSERGALAKNTNEIFVDHPVTGVGMGALPLAMRGAYPDFGFDYQPAHFVLLTASAETGLLGAFFYGVLLISPWGLLWWRRHKLTPELIGVSGALLALSVIGLFDYYTWSRAPGQVWAWMVFGLWVGAYGRSLEAAADA
jgi:O-antigen ligase